MHVLVFIVCLSALSCSEIRVIFDDRDKCVLNAPSVMAEWQLTHADAKIEGWHCEPFDIERPG